MKDKNLNWNLSKGNIDGNFTTEERERGKKKGYNAGKLD